MIWCTVIFLGYFSIEKLWYFSYWIEFHVQVGGGGGITGANWLKTKDESDGS
jgi:hypothetical protein